MTRVLVTGAGGAAGVAVIRALAQAGHHTIAVDADERAAGLCLATDGRVIPPASDAAFGDALTRVVEETGPEVLIGTVSEEIAALHDLRDRLADAGVATWLPPADAVAVCIDKWKFARVLRDAGIPSPVTALGNSHDVPGPWVVKPRFGRGSRDVYRVDDPMELAWACRRTPEPIVQTRATGREFTADVLVAHTGQIAACVPRWRVETKAGISTKGETFTDAAIDDVVARTVEAVGLRGVSNLQGFRDDDGVCVIEVNPRFSGGLPLALAAGADLVGQMLRGALDEPLQLERLRYRAGVRMTRFFDERFDG
ncbi:MAG TPA: ATP-grasp domain-containing protein [Acidimicrobiia bacterium]|nr:ATP-grasp domain-containing protein [Acidimicrobiia bacterium]